MGKPAIADEGLVLDNTDDPQELSDDALWYRWCDLDEYLLNHPEDEGVLAPKLEALDQEMHQRRKRRIENYQKERAMREAEKAAMREAEKHNQLVKLRRRI
jgi:hypothetical protein